MVLVRRAKTTHDAAGAARTAVASPMLRGSQGGYMAGEYVDAGRQAAARGDTTARIETASLVVADLCAGALSLTIAFGVTRYAGSNVNGLIVLLPWIAVAFAGAMLHFASHEHYVRRLPRWTELQASAIAGFGALLATGLAAYLIRDQHARLPVVSGWASFPLTVLATRGAARQALIAAGMWRIPAVVVGDGASVAAADEVLRSAPHLGFVIAGEVAPGQLPQLLTRGGWRGVLRQHGAQMVILAYDETDAERPSAHVIEGLVREQVKVAVLRETHGLPALGCHHTWFVGHETMLLCYATSRAKPVSRVVKSVLDVSLAAVTLLILLPLFLILALAIKADGGPALFAHTRIGNGGRNFHCLKFRTMVRNSDAVLERVLAEDPRAAREWAATQKLRNDPRVTWVGRILRKTSLDEVPQLLNVLRREMSLVGPRPIVSREVSRYAEDISYYYETRPGITGLWQVSGRNNTTYARRVELDRWYVKNWSIAQDFAILARTLPAVLSGRGAS